MPKPVLLPSGRWRVLVRRKGFQRVDELFDSEADADEYLRKALASMHTRRADAFLSGYSTELTLKQAWEGYQTGIKFQGKRPSTQRREINCSKNLLRLLGDTELRLIDEPVIQGYIETRAREKSYRKQKTAGDTVRLEKTLLSQIFAWALLRKHVSRNPAKGGSYEMPKCASREIRLDLDQQHALLDAARDFVNNGVRSNSAALPWMFWTLHTGMRPGEAAKIEIDWIKLKDQLVHIPGRAHKNKTARVVRIPNNLVPLLTKQVASAKDAGSKFVFFSRARATGECVPYDYSDAWRSICTRAGLPTTVVAQGMRHEYISSLIESTTLSDSVVAEMVGDKHTSSLTPYKHLRGAALRDKHSAVEAQKVAEHKAWAHAKFKEYEAEQAEIAAKILAARASKAEKPA